jgi:hypothetical protein
MSEEDAKVAAQGDDSNRVQDIDSSRQGLQNLSVAVMDPTGKERSLNFQWARLHPATVIACTEDNNSPIVELSRKFREYENAASQRKGGKVAGEDEKVHRPSLLTTENVTIDLCELLPDPPLMSEYVDAMFDDDSTDEKMFRKGRSGGPPLMDSSNDTGSLLDRLIDSSVHLMSTEGAESQVSPLHFDLLVLAQHSNSEENLFDLLPSSLILSRLEEIASSTDTILEASVRSMAVVVLIVLAECGACETMSRYILQHLAPAMLVTVKGKVDDAVMQSDLKRLAKALVVSCGLGKMERQELLSLTTVTKEFDSVAYRELVTCLGECYFQNNQT